MQLTADSANLNPVLQSGFSEFSATPGSQYSQYKVIRRNGSVVAFEPGKISVAMT